MKLGKILERGFKTMLLAPLTVARYGTLRPHKVKINECSNWIYIDPYDRRAIKKFIQDPIRKRISQPLIFWRDFLAKLQPSLAIDVGVNYGECLFGARYPASTSVFGFEANPKINVLLQKSRIDHPDASRIKIVASLVSDSIEEAVSFYHDPLWSGTGSAVQSLNDSANTVTSIISSLTIDSVIPSELATGATVLLKMDIEGYEPRAFGGMHQTLDAAQLVVGFIEFDTTFIREAGSDPGTFYQCLENRFNIYFLLDWRLKKLKLAESFEALPVSRADDGRIHTDLLLVTHGADTSRWLPKDWSIV
jgi:FkbM family methyltransferase